MTGSVAGDTVFRNENNNIDFTANGGSSIQLRLTQSGSVGIGSSTPTKTFSVTGTMAVNGLSSATSKNSVCIDPGTKEIVDAGNTTCITSSKKTKHNIDNLTSSEVNDIIMGLRPVAFNYNDGNDRRIGFIAEEVNKVDPRLVELAKQDITYPKASGIIKKGEPVSVEYGNITALLVKAYQSQQKGISTATRSVEENWQWLVIGIMFLWIVRLEIKNRK